MWRLIPSQILSLIIGPFLEDCKYGPVERLYRDCRAMWLEEGAPTVQRITISRNTIKHGAKMEYVL
jgi:hypothetical protein